MQAVIPLILSLNLFHFGLTENIFNISSQNIPQHITYREENFYQEDSDTYKLKITGDFPQENSLILKAISFSDIEHTLLSSARIFIYPHNTGRLGIEVTKLNNIYHAYISHNGGIFADVIDKDKYGSGVYFENTGNSIKKEHLIVGILPPPDVEKTIKNGSSDYDFELPYIYGNPLVAQQSFREGEEKKFTKFLVDIYEISNALSNKSLPMELNFTTYNPISQYHITYFPKKSPSFREILSPKCNNEKEITCTAHIPVEKLKNLKSFLVELK